MRKVMKYPIYPITFSYVSGIFFSQYLNISLNMLWLVTLILCSILFVYTILKTKKFFTTLHTLKFGSLICLLFVLLGILTYKLHNQHIPINDLKQTEFTVKITDVLKSNSYAHRAYAEVISESKNPKVVLNSPVISDKFEVGGVYKILGTINIVNEPRNSYDFNYKKYLQNKNIYYQLNTSHAPYKIGKEESLSVKIIEFRNFLINQFSKLGYNQSTKGFVEALLFGIKTNLDTNIQQQFK